MNMMENKLPDFFARLNPLLVSPSATSLPMEDLLPNFFVQLDEAIADYELPELPKNEYAALDDIDYLQNWFASLKEPLRAVKRSGVLCNPWQVAGIGHDEMRNSAILAWLLSPQGTHGFEDTLLKALLNMEPVRQRLQLDLSVPIETTRVLTESCPTGEITNRFDIEIDDPQFYVVIEVKVNAAEGVEQLKRYCDISRTKAGSRPWCVIFLTRKEKVQFADDFPEKHKPFVLPIAWPKLASHFEHCLKKQDISGVGKLDLSQLLTRLLAQRFFDHVKNFN